MYVLVGGASAMLISKVDMMMIGNLMDLQHVAFYTVAFFIGNVIRVPGKAIVSIAAPLIAKAWEKNNISEIKAIYTKSSINQLLFGIWVSQLFHIVLW
jgi:O-antigen/teichoic acid export membrane protein